VYAGRNWNKRQKLLENEKVGKTLIIKFFEKIKNFFIK
jgi:hypothetical protein